MADAAGPLAFSIEQLYRVFASYPLRARIDACACCTPEGDERRLHGAPLRRLQWDALATFAHNAMTTFGNEDDYRHFLPRLAEIASAGRHGEIPTIARKLAYASWVRWPAREERAIMDWLEALEERALTAPLGDEVSDLLEARNVLGLSVEPLLERAITAASPDVIEEVARRVLDAAARYNHGDPQPRLAAFFRAHRRELDEAFCGAVERWNIKSVAAAADALVFPPFV